MSVPNIGPELPSPGEARRSNPALVCRDEHGLNGVEAASTRASVVTHRFGGVRHGLTRLPQEPADGLEHERNDELAPERPDGGESDPQD